METRQAAIWIGVGSTLGLGLLAAVGAGFMMLPGFGAIFWLIVCGTIVYGINLLRWNNWLYRIAVVIIVTLSVGFWQATSPRADIRFVKHLTLPESKTPGEVAMNTFYRNRGKWRASVLPTFVNDLVPTSIYSDEQKRRAVEDSMYSELEKAERLLSGGPTEVPAEGGDYYLSTTRPISSEDRTEFNNGKLLFVVMGRITYGDWWITKRSTQFCMFVRGDTKIMLNCSRYNEAG